MNALPTRLRDKFAVNESGCWDWRAAKNAWGYGLLNIKGHSSKRAHRVFYELFVGEIPEGLVIDHLCKNRSCVNPAHLEAVTQKENLMRGDAPTSKNARKIFCLKGHLLSGANLLVEKHREKGEKRTCLTCRRLHDKKRRERKANQKST